jgi:hypothetical protein
MAQEE